MVKISRASESKLSFYNIKLICVAAFVVLTGVAYMSFKGHNADMFLKAGEEVFEIPLAQSSNKLDEPLIININTATSNELEMLEGIGETIAARIIEYREQNGLFGNISDIKNVKGIGDKIFENIKNNIVIE